MIIEKMDNIELTHDNIVLYRSEDGKVNVDVILTDETVWVTQDQITLLFSRDKSTISRHIKNIFEDGELDENSVVAFFATTAADGKTYESGTRIHRLPCTRNAGAGIRL